MTGVGFAPVPSREECVGVRAGHTLPPGGAGLGWESLGQYYLEKHIRSLWVELNMPGMPLTFNTEVLHHLQGLHRHCPAQRAPICLPSLVGPAVHYMAPPSPVSVPAAEYDVSRHGAGARASLNFMLSGLLAYNPEEGGRQREEGFRHHWTQVYRHLREVEVHFGHGVAPATVQQVSGHLASQTGKRPAVSTPVAPQVAPPPQGVRSSMSPDDVTSGIAKARASFRFLMSHLGPHYPQTMKQQQRIVLYRSHSNVIQKFLNQIEDNFGQADAPQVTSHSAAVPPPQRQTLREERAKCFHCGDIGHYKWRCDKHYKKSKN